MLTFTFYSKPMKHLRRILLVLALAILAAPACAHAQQNDSTAKGITAPKSAPDPDPNAFIPTDQDPEPDQQVLQANFLNSYPEEARKKGIEGKVEVNLLIDKSGNVKKAVVLHSDNEIFNEPALNAVRNTPFKPAMYKGEPIQVWVSLTIKYQFSR